MRTDAHRNPTAFTTDLAKQAGLVEGKDYTVGEAFAEGRMHTARLLGDPVQLTIRVIDSVGFYTKMGHQRWSYIAMPTFVWDDLEPVLQKRVIGYMYSREGGTEMKELFA
jgi:hypothetical protein